jgi:simple sugar transport system permease protein
MVLAGICAGALWGFIPGLLRATTRTNEVVSSLLANYIAALALLHLVNGPWRDPASFGWAQSPAFPEAARLPLLSGTRLHLLVALAPIAALSGALVFRYGTIGRTARVISVSEVTARVIGLRPSWFYVGSFLLAGALAGLAGFGEVAAIQGRLREGISLGYGFAGFLVAWICRNRFAWLPFAAFAIAGLLTAGDFLQISAGLPFATVNLLQGSILLAFVIYEANRTAQKQRLASLGSEEDLHG